MPTARWLLVLSFPIALAASRPAQACQPPLPVSCVEARVDFPDGATVPTNVPWLPMSLAHDPRNATTFFASEWRLVRSDGAAVPIKIADGQLAPQAALEPGRDYKITYPRGCTASPRVEHRFKTGPERPLTPVPIAESTPGTVTVHSGVEAYSGYFAPCSQLSTIEKAAVARVHFRPSPSARAWSAIGRLGLELDQINQGWATGQLQLPEEESGVIATYYANCNPGEPRGNLALGKHKIWVWFFIGRDRSPAPASAEFELSCDPVDPNANTAPEAPADGGTDSASDSASEITPDGAAPADTSADLQTAVTPDASSTTPDARPPVIAPPVATRSSGGCALAGGGGPAATWPGVGLLALGLWRWRRRRARR